MVKMATLNEFAVNITKLSVALGTNLNVVKRRAAVAIHQTVTVATPVKTGRAKNNWNAELNKPNRVKSLTGSFDKSGAVSIGEAKLVIKSSNEGDSIWISNNLDYIINLNNGSSKKAPAGFVQKGIQTAVNFIRKAKVL
jgi:hypothetical protein